MPRPQKRAAAALSRQAERGPMSHYAPSQPAGRRQTHRRKTRVNA